jgi:hypothetical protein
VVVTSFVHIALGAELTEMADMMPGPVELGVLGLGLLVSVVVVSAGVWFVVRLVKAKSDKG